ncbi:MAG: hypothetical protein IT553_07170 [Sphingomonadaceae bacterium]|nr:hypothetical protein [Sphingomonadaceae bacterium]
MQTGKKSRYAPFGAAQSAGRLDAPGRFGKHLPQRRMNEGTTPGSAMLPYVAIILYKMRK